MKIRAELFKNHVGTDSFICTINGLEDKKERRRMIAVLVLSGFSCKLVRICHNSEYYTFNYIVKQIF